MAPPLTILRLGSSWLRNILKHQFPNSWPLTGREERVPCLLAALLSWDHFFQGSTWPCCHHLWEHRYQNVKVITFSQGFLIKSCGNSRVGKRGEIFKTKETKILYNPKQMETSEQLWYLGELHLLGWNTDFLKFLEGSPGEWLYILGRNNYEWSTNNFKSCAEEMRQKLTCLRLIPCSLASQKGRSPVRLHGNHPPLSLRQSILKYKYYILAPQKVTQEEGLFLLNHDHWDGNSCCEVLQLRWLG